MSNSFRLHLFGLTVILATMLTSCQASETPASPTLPGIGVSITSASCPSSIVKVGDQVVWTNGDKIEHVVHAEASDGSVLFDSGVLKPGDTFTFVFTKAGLYGYRCSPDGILTGTITVEP